MQMNSGTHMFEHIFRMIVFKFFLRFTYVFYWSENKIRSQEDLRSSGINTL